MPVSQDSTHNFILASLSSVDFALLAADLEAVDLAARASLMAPEQALTHVWFPDSAVVSIVAATSGGRRAGLALAGREGMVDISLANGVASAPFACVAQIPGRAWRLPADVLHAAIAASEKVRDALRLYSQSVIVQISTSALVNVSHTLEQRLARWLLMFHDRIDGDEIPITHEFLSMMLGVRRAGITTGVHKLEGAAALRARRGRMIVTDRAALEEIARDAYGQWEAEHARLLGTDLRRAPPPRPNGSYASTASRA